MLFGNKKKIARLERQVQDLQKMWEYGPIRICFPRTQTDAEELIQRIEEIYEYLGVERTIPQNEPVLKKIPQAKGNKKG